MKLVKRILGGIILILLVFAPAYIAYYYGGGTALVVKYFIGTLVWGAIALGAIRLIQMGKFIQILGWLVFFAIAFVPGCIAYLYGGYPTLVGKIYIGVLVGVTIAWSMVTFLRKSEQEI